MRMVPVPEHGDTVSMAEVKDARVCTKDEKGEDYEPIWCGFSDKVLPHDKDVPVWQVQISLPNGDTQDGIQVIYLYDGGWHEV